MGIFTFSNLLYAVNTNGLSESFLPPMILNMSITASIIILFVLLARLALKKTPTVFSYALWAVVLFRLLCPVSFTADFSLLGLFDTLAVGNTQHTTAVEYIPYDVVHTPDLEVQLPVPPVINDAVNDALPQEHAALGADPLEGEFAIGSLIWLLGIGAMVIYSAVSYILLRRKLVDSVPLRENIYLADQIGSPFVMGFIRPKIYLPSALSEQEQGYIILHEQHHIRRGDHIIKALAFIALCIHWFNPLVWVAFVLSSKDMEMSCDEAVLKKLGEGIRADYSASLLSLATGRRIIAGTPLAFGEGDTQSRIKNTLTWKQAKPPVMFLATSAVILAVIICGANPKNNAFAKWAKTVTANEISFAQASKGSGQLTVAHLLSDTDVQEAMALLNKLDSSAYYIDDGGHSPGEYLLWLTYEGYDILFQCHSSGQISVLTDEEYAQQIGLKDLKGGKALWINSDALYEFIVNLVETSGIPIGKEGNRLTLLEVIELSQKGSALTWSDFETFDYVETGSGLYIRHYEIDDIFSLYIGGSGPDSEPMYIYLWSNFTATSPMIDIRTEDVNAYLSEQGRLQAEYLNNNDPLPEEFPLGMLFASGAGAWGTTMTLYPDGTFVGSYSDSDMGDNGDGYPHGTHYTSEFYGRFDSIKKTDNLSWSLTLADLYTTTPEGETWVEDGVRYVASAPHGLAEGKEFILYAPGTPAENLAEDFLSWWPNAYLWRQGELEKLDCYGLYNVNSGHGFFASPSVSDVADPLFTENTSVDATANITNSVANDEVMRRLGEVTLHGTTFYDRNLAPSTVIFSNPEIFSEIERAFSSHQWEFADAPESEPRWTNLIELPPFVFYDQNGLVRYNASSDASILWSDSALKDTVWYRAPGMFEAMQEVTGTFFPEEPAQPPTRPVRETLGGTPLQILKSSDTFEEANTYLDQLMKDWRAEGVGTLHNAKVGVHNYSKEEKHQSYLVKDHVIYAIPLPYVNGMLDYARPVNSHLDMNQWTYTYEVVVPETVQLSDSTVYHAGTYTYLVDLLDLTYQFSLIPAENAFSPADVEFSGQAITTTFDPMTYDERLVWVQAEPEYGTIAKVPLGQYAEGEGCLAYTNQWVGVPHNAQYGLSLRFADNTIAEHLPLPQDSLMSFVLPDTLEFQNGKLVYQVTFPHRRSSQ